jgi:hypothetical protein
MIKMQSGFYYKAPITAASQISTAVVNTTYYTAFYISETITMDRIGIATNAGHSGSAVIRLGIYNNDTATGKPSTVFLDAGTVLTGVGIGASQIVISQSISPGIYWFAFNSQTAATTNTYRGTAGAADALNTVMGHLSVGQTSSVTVGFSQGSVTGAFATAGTLTQVQSIPFTWFRMA